MFRFIIFLLLFINFLYSCSTKKESVKISIDLCDNIAEKIVKDKPDKGVYRITGVVKGKGFLYLLLKGYINSKTKIDLYTPFGKKVYSIVSVNNNIFSLNDGKDIILLKKRDFYKFFLKTDIPFSLKNLVLGKFNLDNSKYVCEGNNIVFLQPLNNSSIKYIYSVENGKIQSLEFKNFSVIYIWKDKKFPSLIKFLKNKKTKVKLKIKSLKKIDENG